MVMVFCILKQKISEKCNTLQKMPPSTWTNIAPNRWGFAFKLSRFNRPFVVCVIFCLFPPPILAGQVAHILVVTDMYEEPYNETIHGFKEQISKPINVKFTELTMAQAKFPADKKIAQIKPDVIFAVGSQALKWASSQLPNTPTIATLVFNDSVIMQSDNVTGVRMYYSLETQFRWLNKLFPKQKKIAVLFNPKENSVVVEKARKVSLQYGFKLVAIPVETPKELPYALAQLVKNNKVDLQLAIPDATVMSTTAAKEVLLSSFRNKLPLIGLNDNWVRTGALYALSWDFADLGRQSALIAKKILHGLPVDTVLPEYPRKVAYTINAKTAGHMNFEIPNDLLNHAKMVFK